MYQRLPKSETSVPALLRAARILANQRRGVFRPALANDSHLALDRSQHNAEPVRDLFVRATLGLPHRDRLQIVVSQAVEHPLALLRHLQNEIRRQLPGCDAT